MVGQKWQQRRIRRRLMRVHAALVIARQEVTVAEEQLVAFVDEADEAKVRFVVSENRFDEETSSAADRHREVMNRALETARRRVGELEETERKLLAELAV
jgi:signal recognition particle receptor subunit beta